jgi:hypothetical protein
VLNLDKANPLDAVPHEDILTWCEHHRTERYPTMASAITLFRPGEEKATLEWSETAEVLLDRAPDRLAVLKEYVRRFQPHTYSGSLAAVMEGPLAPLNRLEEHADPAVAEFAKMEGVRLRQEVEEVRRHETEEDRQTDERFE